MFYAAIESRLRMAKMRHNRIARVMSRARHIFALVTTFGLARNREKRAVRRRWRKFQNWWLHTLEQLCTHGLWSPVSDQCFSNLTPDEANRFDFAFGLCTRCLPLCVKWAEPRAAFLRRIHRKINAQIIPCRKTHFCPSCFASLSANQYRKFKEVVNDLIQSAADISVTTHVAAVFVPATVLYDKNLQQDAYLRENIGALRREITRAKVLRQQLHKRLQRNTLGSFWRLIAVPLADGWRLETRWVVLHRTDSVAPIVDAADSVVRFHNVISLEYATWRERFSSSDLDDTLSDALARFAKYPVALIRGDVDLIAAWLNASAKTKLVLGTGLLQQAGSSLIGHYKKRDRRDRRSHAYRRHRRAGQTKEAQDERPSSAEV